MTVQETSRAGRALNLPRTGSAPSTPRQRPVRRLPVQKDWPLWAIIAAQLGIFIGLIALWELAADTGAIDGFFWSKPSAIYATLIKFFTDGDAWVDISFTFRSTIIGFLIGTTFGSLLGLSFWWSRNYAAIVQPYVICFETLPKLALAPLVILVFGLGLASKVAIATALTLVVSTLTTYAGVKAVDPDQERLFYSLGANTLSGVSQAGGAVLPAVDHLGAAGEHRAGFDRRRRRRIHRRAARPRPPDPLRRPDLRHRAGLGRGSGALDARRHHVRRGVMA